MRFAALRSGSTKPPRLFIELLVNLRCLRLCARKYLIKIKAHQVALTELEAEASRTLPMIKTTAHSRGGYYCESCPVRDRGLCSAVSECAAADIRQIAHHKRALTGQILHSDYEGPNWLAVVVSGVIKLVKAQKDGRQQIVGLRFPGDIIGRPYSDTHPLIAEATTKLELCCFTKSSFEDLIEKHPSVENVLLRRALDDLDDSREWMFVLGRKRAREKVASLLALIAARFAGRTSDDRDETPVQFDLPLSRHEIADVLGLTLETVSRELKALKSMGLISTKGRRHLEVHSMDALDAVAEGEPV